MTRPYRKSLMTVKEVAAVFEVKELTIRQWCRDGKILAAKPGKSWRIPRSEVERLAQAKYGGL